MKESIGKTLTQQTQGFCGHSGCVCVCVCKYVYTVLLSEHFHHIEPTLLNTLY